MRRRGIGLNATEDLVPEEEVLAAWRKMPPLLPALGAAVSASVEPPRAVPSLVREPRPVSEIPVGPFEEVSLFDPAPFESEAPARKQRRRRRAA